MKIDFTGRVAVVTGAGGGLGRAHAMLLARRGAKVVVNDVGGAPADAVVAEIRAQGGEAVANSDSVATPDGAKNIIDTAIESFGRIDVLVNNAGNLRDRGLAKMTIDDIQSVIGVHLMGSMYCTHAAWPHLMAQKYGRILLTSSTSGLAGNFGQSNYGAAKAGMVGFMNCLVREGAKNNVLVNALAPSATTRMTENILPPQLAQHMRPELVSPVVAWLCSEACTANGDIISAGAGGFQRIRFFQSEGVQFDPQGDVTPEMVGEAYGRITDMTGAEPLGNQGPAIERRLKALGRL